MAFLDDDIDIEYEFEEEQNKPLYRKATVQDRLIAGVIDLLVCGFLTKVPFAIPILALAYLMLRDSIPFLNGQSIGKKVMNLQAVEEQTGETLVGKYDKAFLRNVTLIIPIFQFFDVFRLISTKTKRHGDEWANSTIVIKLEQ